MEIDKILVIILGTGLIGLTYWFFFGKRDEAVESTGLVKVIVSGGYNPSTVKIKKGEETTFQFIRKDASTCLEEVIIPEFKVKEFLPLNKAVEVKITPQKKGEYRFQCGMNMYHGKIIVG